MQMHASGDVTLLMAVKILTTRGPSKQFRNWLIHHSTRGSSRRIFRLLAKDIHGAKIHPFFQSVGTDIVCCRLKLGGQIQNGHFKLGISFTAAYGKFASIALQIVNMLRIKDQQLRHGSAETGIRIKMIKGKPALPGPFRKFLKMRINGGPAAAK